MRRVANQRFLTAMLDMGFRKDHAELALAETGNVGVEVRAEKQPPLAVYYHNRMPQQQPQPASAHTWT